jgi:thiamine-phosphate pyrophosphorylase
MPPTKNSSTLKKGLYLILTEPRDGYENLTQWAVKARLAAIQLRYKGKDEDRLYKLAKTMRRLTSKSDTLFIVNDRPDIALAVHADGVHVGQEDISPVKARQLIGEQMLLGLSTHNLDQVEQANTQPVDYIGFGPLYATTSKAKPDPVLGPQTLTQAAQISKHPIVAIGGLNFHRIKNLKLFACRNVAVISAVSLTKDPYNMMQTLNTYIQEQKRHAP